jgi:acetyltransferase-like isoleucine patch superfamily enzyme
MKLRHVNGCSGGTCPAVFETDRGTYVVQGSVVTDPDALAALDLPAHETAVEVPASLLASLKVKS